MQTIRIYRLKDLDQKTRARLRAAQLEAARVWRYCLERHQRARSERTRWPDRDDLQRETKGGQYALHSQSIQLVCQQFLANVETIKQLRHTNPRHRYPYHPKRYRTVQWPAQSVSRQGKRLTLPMGRGRKSFSFHLPTFPEAEVPAPASPGIQAAVDLGEIHQAAVTTSTGQGLIITGRGMRAVKQGYNRTLGQLSRLQARYQKGSKRWRRLQYTRAREGGKSKRRVRDLRHKGTRQVVDFCRAEGVQTLYVGDPHGVRSENKGRHHNQRMAQWEYGKDRQYLQEKCSKAGIECFSESRAGNQQPLSSMSLEDEAERTELDQVFAVAFVVTGT
jgi:putative transposase